MVFSSQVLYFLTIDIQFLSMTNFENANRITTILSNNANNQMCKQYNAVLFISKSTFYIALN